MKFIVSFLLMAAFGFAACTIFPWWSIAITTFIIALLIPQKPGIAFLCGFISLFLLWGTYTLYISNLNAHILAHKVSILILKNDNPMLLILLTALIGGLIAGFAALAGSLLCKPTVIKQQGI